MPTAPSAYPERAIGYYEDGAGDPSRGEEPRQRGQHARNAEQSALSSLVATRRRLQALGQALATAREMKDTEPSNQTSSARWPTRTCTSVVPDEADRLITNRRSFWPEVGQGSCRRRHHSEQSRAGVHHDRAVRAGSDLPSAGNGDRARIKTRHQPDLRPQQPG